MLGTVLSGIFALVLVPALGAAEVGPPTQLSFDPFVGAPGQHETAVEPDSLSVGDVVVAVFQVARILDGGATAIGWATSPDGGTTWTSGLLPELTTAQSPLGAAARVSDPVIAFDRVHGVWLASVLALREASPLPTTSLVVSRSVDGRSWSTPVTMAADEGRFAHDKNWIVCDNGAASPLAGTCYVAWTDATTGALAMSRSIDGGSTWTPPTVAGASRGGGFVPLVRPDGTVVVVYETVRTIEAVRSRDGGRSFDAPIFVSALRTSPVPGMRAPALPSAEVDAAGRITVAWQDCRFRQRCPATTAPNDIVTSSSPDGLRWSPVRRVPTAPALDGLHHFVPGVGVDATSSGAASRLAVAFSVLAPRGCAAEACSVQPQLVSTTDGGRNWSEPVALAPPQPVSAFPQSTAGRFLGDYISTSFVSGDVAVPVFASASGPFDGRFRQGVFASRVPPLPARPPVLRVSTPRVTPSRPRVGARFVVSAPFTNSTSGAVNVQCRARGARVRLRLLRGAALRGRATCTWRVLAAPRRALVGGTITVGSPEAEIARPFRLRVR